MTEANLKDASRAPVRPDWLSPELFPYESRFVTWARAESTTSTRGTAPSCSCCTATRRGRSSTAA